MSKARTQTRDPGRRPRAPGPRAAAGRSQLRNRMLLAGGAVLAVVAVVVALVVVKLGAKPAAAPAGGPTGAPLASAVHDLTSVPAAVLDTVAAGSIGGVGTPGASSGYLAPVSGPPLTAAGQPEVLYVGAEFCPFCAAVRWPLIVALSRFGTFSGLSAARSGIANGAGQPEPYPATPTWTFYGSSYTSRYLTFSPVELQTSTPDPATGSYTALQKLTQAQQSLVARYDSSGSVPFMDIGNAYVQMSSLPPYGPQDLQNLTWSQIAAALHDPSTALAKAIDGSANYLTAAFCTLTGNQPASACTPTVRSLESRLG